MRFTVARCQRPPRGVAAPSPVSRSAILCSVAPDSRIAPPGRARRGSSTGRPRRTPRALPRPSPRESATRSARSYSDITASIGEGPPRRRSKPSAPRRSPSPRTGALHQLRPRQQRAGEPVDDPSASASPASRTASTGPSAPRRSGATAPDTAAITLPARVQPRASMRRAQRRAGRRRRHTDCSSARRGHRPSQRTICIHAANRPGQASSHSKGPPTRLPSASTNGPSGSRPGDFL